MLTIQELIQILQYLKLTDKEINSLNLSNIVLEIDRELYQLTIKLLKEKYINN